MSAVYIPQDSTACALGADAVAQAVAEQSNRPLVRNGSRGIFWLEPLLEADTNSGRIAFGPMSEADVPGVLAALDSEPSGHPLYLGDIEQHDYFKDQHRSTFRRAGIDWVLEYGRGESIRSGAFLARRQAAALRSLLPVPRS